MKTLDFIISSNCALISYIVGTQVLFYSPSLRKKIREETKDIDPYSYWRYKYDLTGFANIVGAILILTAFYDFVKILRASMESNINPLVTILLLAINILIQNLIIVYLIKSVRKIKTGEKKEFLGFRGFAIEFSVIPEYMFWIYLIIAYPFHIALVLKILF